MVASNSEFPFQAGRARWNTGGNITVGKIPTSICSSPCGMGEIKNFEVEKKMKQLREKVILKMLIGKLTKLTFLYGLFGL